MAAAKLAAYAARMTTEALEQAFASTRSVLANVKPDQLDATTPCESWDVRALVNHIVGGCHFFTEAVNTGTTSGNDETDYTAGDMVASYDDGIKQAVAAFNEPGAQEKMLTLPFGTMPGAAFMGLATTDAFVHGWDLARATGQSTDLAPELAAQLLTNARMFIQPAFRGDDGVMPFGAEKEAPANATEADKLAAFLGRDC